ncbi:probable E3 ubiquitin-protein ligase ARI8 [Macadamia integrifolia]|uniref:probable E3 ubiquitin-protein ligase ARI8 n=1 Tax=Macadamia integrifolia TaxID=60698 RepID=UPI001C4F893A|nr:probable E3 ubiquitin-protein ligase ARI8 [Macadamia integrifolia]
MDSEDDKYSNSDVEYLVDDHLYSDNVKKFQTQQQNYTILSEADIRRRQEEDITKISTVLSISRSWSSILMRHYNWSITKVQEEWFADEEKVCKAVGLSDKPVVLEIQEKVKEVTCNICFENFCSLDKVASAVCGHLFCVSCWAGYISSSIKDGPGCLMLRCPDQSCSVAIDQDLIDQFTSEEDKEKFSNYLLRSYVETNRKIKWCPSPGCGYAVKFAVASNSRSWDVTCHCSYSFCWNCTEEVHRPVVDCDTVGKWVLKQSHEGANVNWVLTHSKPCPKCKRQIEKNDGCLHITCTPPCKYEFCWLCLGPWSKHGELRGGFYSCDKFLKSKLNGTYDEAEKRREMAENSLDRSAHYYERWASNHSLGKEALANLQEIQTGKKLKELSLGEGVSEMELESIREAWLLIVECRRVLKWTYVYGYYLPEYEEVKRAFFEYLQGEAESGLKRLHYCVEKELKGYLEVEGSIPDFHEFLTKIVGLTKVTRNYFKNLVQAFENGLSDVTCVDKDTDRQSHRRIMKCLAWCRSR